MRDKQKKIGRCRMLLCSVSAVLVLLGGAALAESRTPARDAGTPATDYQIAIRDFSFQPAVITVPAGAQVVWINKDEEPHTVVSSDSAFKSKALDTDERFSFAFAKPGTYEYFCSVHPRMTGKIIVK